MRVADAASVGKNNPLILLGLLALVLISQRVAGQELEARAYAPNPVGARFLVLSYAHSDGDMLLNSSSPIKDFEISANSYVTGVGGTFAIADRFASVALGVPYIDGTAEGRLNGVPQRADRAGLGDLKLRLTLSLLPGSAQSPADFTRNQPDRTLGARLVVSAPTGEYFADKLVNLGTNRWAFRPTFGCSLRFGRWNDDGS